MALAGWSLLFLLAGVGLAWGGVHLARAGDALAERAGWSRLLVGMVLVAAATSLPEVLTDVSAALADAPDLAVGDLFGSSMANMAILAVIDLAHRGRVWPSVELGQSRVATVAIALTAVAGIGMLTPEGPAIGRVGFDAVVIVVAYLAAVAWIRRSTRLTVPTLAGALPVPTGWSLRVPGSAGRAALRLAWSALIVVATAPFVALAGREIADASGIAQSFIGVTLVAIATSLPELVASLAAVRIGAYDLAVGNLFGSNALNMAVLVIVDLAYAPGPILSAAGPGHAVAAFAAVLLMATAVAAIVMTDETRLRRFEPDAVLVLLLYGAGLAAVWGAGA